MVIDQGDPSSSDGHHVDAIRSAVRALNSGVVEEYLQHFDHSCLRWISGFESPLTLAEVSDNLRQLRDAFGTLLLEEEHLFGSGRLVCARWRLRGVHQGEFMGHAPTHRTIDVQTCEVYEFGEESVVATWTYGDPMRLFRQISAGSEQGSVQ